MVAHVVVGIEHGTVAPLDGPLVVVVDAGEDAGTAYAVLRLCHIVEARIVHDAGGVAVFLDKSAGAEAVNGHGAGCAEIVAKAESMTHLMGRDKADEFAHQFGVIIHFLGGLVNVAGLYHVPVVNEFHHVMIPANMAFNDFAGAGVVYLGAVGIFNGRGQVADAGVACIFHRHGAVVLRPFLTHDGILETGFLESLLPIVDSLDEIGAPLFRGGGINVINNGLLRFYQLAAPHLFHIGTVFRLQTPTGDETLGLDALLKVGEEGEVVREVAHAGVEQAAHHGHLGQKDEGDVQAQRNPPREGRGVIVAAI